MKNLLVNLHKWVSRQDENYVTEAFAHLVATLLSREPQPALGFIGWLVGAEVGQGFVQAAGVEVVTQMQDEGNQPDIRMYAGSAVAYVEVKVESGVDRDQLRRYKEELDRVAQGPRALVLLTRHAVTEDSSGGHPNVCRRWHEVAERLEQLDVSDAVAAYLVGQFLEFLRERGMAVEHVDVELAAGMRAATNLMKMAEAGLLACGARPQPLRGATNHLGYYFNKKEAWAGIYWSEPTILLIEQDSRRLHILDLEQTGFFDLSREDQYRAVEEFVRVGPERLRQQ
ncbi:PD-(D/E)XK nuclease family protein [candidate division WOR-3 bacterium]|nr:PD-(D/E)XK nuclease family protein [candidate division WOR-3 bacterium]